MEIRLSVDKLEGPQKLGVLCFCEFFLCTMDRHNLSQADLLSIVSLNYARNELLEPPWYGFFGIILREYMSRVEGNVATFFIPQLPITVEVDDIDIDDHDASGDWDEEDDDEGYESPTPARASHVEALLVSHALTEEGGIHLIFNISLLIGLA